MQTSNESTSPRRFLDRLASRSLRNAFIRNSGGQVRGSLTTAQEAFKGFTLDYPEYLLTGALDSLRKRDFGRLRRSGEVYVDFMGGCLYPESLVRAHTKFLNESVLGNTHSVSGSSMRSFNNASEARQAVLSHFHAPPSEYAVVFTANATAALKLVGEAYPFSRDSRLVIGVDSHNSIHGLREFASTRDADTLYIPSTPRGGFKIETAKEILKQNQPPKTESQAPRLFAATGQSNISNNKLDLSVCSYAASLGYDVLLDAAALAPTSTIDLSNLAIDAMAVSFYKMFGYPTGVGALVAKKSFLEKLKRPWFAGGTVEIVQVPGRFFTRTHELHEQFEDGTINFLQLSVITKGLGFLSEYLPLLPLRLSSLVHYLSSSLSSLRHDTTGQPVIKILSQIPMSRTLEIGEQSDTGFLLSCLFLDPSGNRLPNAFVEYAATANKISLRTGCMCNPGGSASLLGMEEDMRQMYPGVTVSDIEMKAGQNLGVIRISLGLASNFQDVWRVIQFASTIANKPARQELCSRWMLSRQTSSGM